MARFLANAFMADSALSKRFLQPVFNFGIRFYVAFIFFKSGLNKVDDKFQVTQSTKDVFATDFNVPFIPSDIAVYLVTYAELILPILLVLGLFTRLSALLLFITIASVAYPFTQTNIATAILWAVLFATVFIYGPSKASIDSWLADRWRDRETSLILKLVSIIILSGIGYFLLNKYL